VKQEVLGRPVGQSVLVSRLHPGPETNFSFTSVENIFRHFPVFLLWDALSDERTDLYLLLQLLLRLPSAVTLGSKARRTPDHILLPHLRLGPLSAASTPPPPQYWQVQVILRPTVRRPVWPGLRPPSRTRGQFFLLPTDTVFRHSRYFVVWGALSNERTDL
jgi:hypothetical protein